MVMSEQTTTITSREMAMPFQFLCGGLTSTNSCTNTQNERAISVASHQPGRGVELQTIKHPYVIVGPQNQHHEHQSAARTASALVSGLHRGIIMPKQKSSFKFLLAC